MKASENSVKTARLFGLLGMISLLSYAAAVIFAPRISRLRQPFTGGQRPFRRYRSVESFVESTLGALYAVRNSMLYFLRVCGSRASEPNSAPRRLSFCRYELGFRGRLRNVSAPEFGKTRRFSGRYAPCNNRGGRCFERRFSCFDYLRRIPKKDVAVSCRIGGDRAYGNVCRRCGNGCFAYGIFRHSRTFQRFFRNGVQCRSRRLSVFRKTRKSGT